MQIGGHFYRDTSQSNVNNITCLSRDELPSIKISLQLTQLFQIFA
jgi:hypothetical protein